MQLWPVSRGSLIRTKSERNNQIGKKNSQTKGTKRGKFIHQIAWEDRRNQDQQSDKLQLFIFNRFVFESLNYPPLVIQVTISLM
jgi:hypothetical protein